MAPQITDLLESPYLTPAIGIFLILYVATSYIRAWYRLRHISGPPLAAFSYLWVLFKSLTGKQAQQFRAVSEKYGTLARIGPNDLLTSDPDLIRRMNGARSAYCRSNWYKAAIMDLYHDTLFSLLDTGTHDKLKARLSFGYGGKENPGLEGGIDAQLAGLVDLIDRKYLSTEAELRPVDMATKVHFFTLDALSSVAYGKEFGFLATDSDVHGYIEATEKMLPSMSRCTEVPWLRKVLMSPTLLHWIGPKPTDKTGYGRMLA